jgi:O-antigen ligase
MPIMLTVFALLHLKWRTIVILLCVTTAFGGLAWATSPLLRWKAETVPFFYEKQTLATVGVTSALCQEQTSCQ